MLVRRGNKMSYVIERWSGKAWYASMCSPYKTMGELNRHLKEYWWHYTEENPYRIKDFKPKKKIQQYTPKYNAFQDWNSDKGMVVKV
jgi:hypothetical protein